MSPYNFVSPFFDLGRPLSRRPSTVLLSMSPTPSVTGHKSSTTVSKIYRLCRPDTVPKANPIRSSTDQHLVWVTRDWDRSAREGRFESLQSCPYSVVFQTNSTSLIFLPHTLFLLITGERPHRRSLRF